MCNGSFSVRSYRIAIMTSRGVFVIFEGSRLFCQSKKEIQLYYQAAIERDFYYFSVKMWR